MPIEFTVCCLMYGNYPQLARRMFDSFRHASMPRAEWRIGFNRTAEETHTITRSFFSEYQHTVTEWFGEKPYYKYPLMRRMFHERRIVTPYVLWFDDDSYLANNASGEQLFSDIRTKLNEYHMLGAPYRQRLRGNQDAYIRDQPWFTGADIKPYVDFITGGWWAIRTEVLCKHNWPSRDLEHNGGDVMLGALCAQQGYKLGKYTANVCINADDSGSCSTAVRRGASTQPVGVGYTKPEKKSGYSIIPDRLTRYVGILERLRDSNDNKNS